MISAPLTPQLRRFPADKKRHKNTEARRQGGKKIQRHRHWTPFSSPFKPSPAPPHCARTCLSSSSIQASYLFAQADVGRLGCVAVEIWGALHGCGCHCFNNYVNQTHCVPVCLASNFAESVDASHHFNSVAPACAMQKWLAAFVVSR